MIRFDSFALVILCLIREEVDSVSKDLKGPDDAFEERTKFIDVAAMGMEETSSIADLGIIHASRTKRVVGGSAVNEYDYPFVVPLLNSNNKVRCSGTVLAPNLILTAAHCLVKGRSLHIRYASTNENVHSSIEISIISYITHPDYVKETFEHDIAIAILEVPIINPIIKPLIDKEYVIEDESARFLMFGLGKCIVGLPCDGKLRVVQLQILPKNECENRSLPRYDMVCTGLHVRVGSSGQRTEQIGHVCDGDSGGPLMLNEYQIGVATCLLLSENDRIVLGSGFTSVASHRDWITEQIDIVQELQPIIQSWDGPMVPLRTLQRMSTRLSHYPNRRTCIILDEDECDDALPQNKNLKAFTIGRGRYDYQRFLDGELRKANVKLMSESGFNELEPKDTSVI
ncbi:hypothetical protein QAD02_011822 [Eretmocerus hayati]|uniref:Uncharacterized protein n=1 Tax=Eretmocerus hayati TaxID=131215 RepID=A0ACC2NZ23_9HYME|nr:hypothetical protein QAD02_011822 [Eretmocerus hayati]